MTQHTPIHLPFMNHALRLAERQLGRTWPNPAVGCVIVKDGQIIGVGATGKGGRPHAETLALEMAGDAAQGATLYSTLEPCSHHGKTPPCAEAVIAAGIRHVVSACRDPDERVSGKGIALLQSAGIDITEGIAHDAAWALNEGFFCRTLHQRPLVTLKIATSLDGILIRPPGSDRWITGKQARSHGQLLRARHDAILTGIGTVLADDPQLTCRVPGLEYYSPVRIVLDSQLRMPVESVLARSAQDVPVWLFTTQAQMASDAARRLEDQGVKLLNGGDEKPYIDLPIVLVELAKIGITRLMVEGGHNVTTHFLQEGLVDWLYWYRAPLVIGSEGVPAIRTLPDCVVEGTPHQRFSLGVDHCDLYRLNPCLPALSQISAE